jgi:hypothetical protein
MSDEDLMDGWIEQAVKDKNIQLTYQQIAVPETLLKKRRTTEASREAKLKAAAEARQVSEGFHFLQHKHPQHNDAKHNHQFQASRDYAAELTIFRV